MMQMAFCRSSSPISWGIRVVTWSPWSHVAILNGNDVVEAVYPRVCTSTLDKLLAKYDEVQVVAMPCARPDLAWAAALSQVGKPYDVLADLGILIHHQWDHTDKWICSELAVWVIAQGGTELFRPDLQGRITPGNLWMLEPAV